MPDAPDPRGPAAREDVKPLIAVIDDDPMLRRLAAIWLEHSGYEVVGYGSGSEALAAIEKRVPSLVCLDLQLGDMRGLDVLPHLRAIDPLLPVIVVTSHNDVETAVSAMRGGAWDYLVKPLDRAKLEQSVRSALDRWEATSRAQRDREARDAKILGGVIGQSAPMRELERVVRRVLESDVSVCLLGESGTGKELVARAIHQNGRRRRGPFVAINCAAIPEALQESELFGHERGAFTGAAAAHAGRFEQANGGTLFLDELGEMNPSTQAALLRTLQERTVRRVGGRSEIPVDVRVICATHRDLAALAREGRFREDLYFRLVVYPVNIPPLRERRDDLPLLVAHFLRRFASDVARDVTRVSPDAIEALSRHSWPGNVRELQNVVHRAMLSCEGDEISLWDLPIEIRRQALPSVPARDAVKPDEGRVGDRTDGAVSTIEELERRAIKQAMDATNGNVGQAAKLLGIGRATLYRRLADIERKTVDG